MKILSINRFDFFDLPWIIEQVKEAWQAFRLIRAVIDFGGPLLQRFLKKPHKVEISSENIFYARFQSPGHKLSGCFGLGLYNISILNNTKSIASIKNVELQYELDEAQYRIPSYVVMTGTCYSPLTKTTENVLLMTLGKNAICSSGWNNIRVEIGKNQILEPNAGVLSASAYFLFDFDKAKKLSQIKNIKLLVTNWSGRKSSHAIPFSSKIITQQQYLELVNKQFVVDASSKIIMV